MTNLEIFESVNKDEIVQRIPEDGAHFTNGTYAFPAEMIIPTTIAGFEHVNSLQPSLPLVIAVNSDKSMKALGKDNFESQIIRANKVAIPLAEKFPSNKVIVIFYDETTPNKLYEKLAEKKLTKTLHKWGYGTSPDAPKVEGAELFDHVYGFPLPNDTKPVCYDITAQAPEPQKIEVVDLRAKFRKTNLERLTEFASTHKFALFSGAVTALAAAGYALMTNSDTTGSQP